jgi:hypothetical protein
MDIKSAYEIAMEKVDKIGEASEEERLKWKYTPEGGKLAAIILKEDIDIAEELKKYDPKAVVFVVDEAVNTLLRNINLPRNEGAKRNNKRAMDAIKILKKDKVKVENVLSQMRRIFSHYTEQGEQQRRQAYEQVKEAFQAKVQQALQQQVGSAAGIKIDVEKQPQFQEEWRNVQNQFDSQYIRLLDEFKKELLNIN